MPLPTPASRRDAPNTDRYFSAGPSPTLSENISVWARRALAVATLTEVDVWDAFDRRQEIAAALAAGATASSHLEAMLAGADDLWHDQRARVAPILRLGTYLQSRPPAHYVHQYLAEASP